MIEHLSHSEHGNIVLLFGPQALSLDEHSFQNIRSTVLGTAHHKWILEIIAEFPKCFDAISKAFPTLSTPRRRQLVEDLKTWFETGDISWKPFILPNILLSPLVIIAQLIDYTETLGILQSKIEEAVYPYISSKHVTETLGFCTGFLTAIAVSCASNTERLHKYGAVALRLGMLIGLVVDAQDESAEFGDSKSFAIVWKTAESKEEVIQIVKKFPQVK